MNKRKKILIDKKFQLKTIFSVIGIVYFAASVVIAAIGINAIINNRKLDEIIKSREKIITTQKDVLDSLAVFSKEKNWDNLILARGRITEDIKTNSEIINETTAEVKEIYDNTSLLLYGIIFIIVLKGIFLYFMLLRKSHRIVGPIHHISEYIRDITEKKYPKIRPLRKNDEFQEFHELVVKMAESLKKDKL